VSATYLFLFIDNTLGIKENLNQLILEIVIQLIKYKEMVMK